jgi:hypothetical protein
MTEELLSKFPKIEKRSAKKSGQKPVTAKKTIKLLAHDNSQKKVAKKPVEKLVEYTDGENANVHDTHDTLKKGIRMDATPDKMFILVNGHKVKNVKELADIMSKIEDYVFYHHVTDNKNDFATWLRDVFEEVGLAEELGGVKDKKHMQLVLYKHITHRLW